MLVRSWNGHFAKVHKAKAGYSYFGFKKWETGLIRRWNSEKRCFPSIERTGDRQMIRMISDEWVNDLDDEWINQMRTREPHRYLKKCRGKDELDDFAKHIRSDLPRWL
jgi:hypothetical protein